MVDHDIGWHLLSWSLAKKVLRRWHEQPISLHDLRLQGDYIFPPMKSLTLGILGTVAAVIYKYIPYTLGRAMIMICGGEKERGLYSILDINTNRWIGRSLLVVSGVRLYGSPSR